MGLSFPLALSHAFLLEMLHPLALDIAMAHGANFNDAEGLTTDAKSKGIYTIGEIMKHLLVSLRNDIPNMVSVN
jgi:hypothetical protein